MNREVESFLIKVLANMLNQKLQSLFVALVMIAVVSGCSNGKEYPVASYVTGTLKVRAEVDSTDTFEGFRISVLTQTEGNVDTLGTAVTVSGGHFEMMVYAPDEGIYPIVVERSGASLSLDDFVAVNGDTVQVSGTFPLGTRPLRVVSAENAAWSAYKNSKATHNDQMVTLLEAGGYTTDDIGRVNAQTATILWSIQNTYPSTMGGAISMAESVVMSEGWDDAVVLERYPQVGYDNSSIVAVVRAARRSIARVAGQDSAIAMLNRYLNLVPSEKEAEILSEKVMAFADSLQTERAVATASQLRMEYPESEWSSWASRATYDLENLQPGMAAPGWSLTSREGELLDTAGMDGRFVILEFFDPAEQIFQNELRRRDELFGALGPNVFQVVSVSVEPDADINEALFDGDGHPGHFVWTSAGMQEQIVADFNIQLLPTRYLIDPNGVIIAKYTGPALANLERDLIVIVGGLNDIAKRIQQ